MAKLSEDEVVTLQVLKEKGETNRAIARRLGVTEGAVRYHLRRRAAGARDGRRKVSLIDRLGLAGVVEHWWKTQQEALPAGRPPNVQALWAFLVEEYHYSGSYKSVRKFVRGKYPAPKQRPFRWIETPPGAQTQSDWMVAWIDIGDPPAEGSPGVRTKTKLYGFLMTLSHSRQTAVIWSRSMKQLAWHRVHNEAFK